MWESPDAANLLVSIPKGRGRLGIIALVPDDWNSIVMVRHQILSRLARRFPVVWIDPARGWRDFINPSRDFLRGDRWTEAATGLHVLAPGCRHPQFYRPEFLSRLAMKSRLSAAARHLRMLGAERIALYLWRDEFAPAIDLIEHDFSCYHIDDEYSFAETEHPITENERRLIARVDHVIVHSPALMEKKGGINPSTSMIPNGVDFSAYSAPAAAPPELADIPRPIIGYTGVIKRQLDLELLLNVAKARPGYSFVLVGPIKFVTGKEHFLEALRRLKNVHLLGERRPEDLPGYVQNFDVCLMCYEVNDYTRYIYPLKLHEYLATGQPVVSSHIESVVRTAAPVSLATTVEEWLSAIDNGLLEEARSPEARARRVDTARKHDWDVLAGQVADVFETSRSTAGPFRQAAFSPAK